MPTTADSAAAAALVAAFASRTADGTFPVCTRPQPMCSIVTFCPGHACQPCCYAMVGGLIRNVPRGQSISGNLSRK